MHELAFERTAAHVSLDDRLERELLVLKAPEWEGLTWQGGGTTSDRNEGSDW